jgi:signal transduction histidine kinase/ActR/RegA family two-component response regulator
LSTQLTKKELEQKISDLEQEVVLNRQVIEKYKEQESRMHQPHRMDAIGTLAGGIAHDFNNILGIILGNTELALRDLPVWDPAHDLLAEIKTASIRAEAIVKRILSFSRKMEDHVMPIHLGPTIKESMRLLSAMIPSSIEIKMMLAASHDTILADPVQIHQVMTNICTNAYHAMRGVGGTLTIRLRTLSMENVKSDPNAKNSIAYVQLSIEDTGHGIEKDVLDRIFEPYFTTKDFSMGSGLGLSVVHGIVESLGGKISVISQLGKGSTFEILLPVADVKIPESEFKKTATIKTGTERILFIDDEIALARLGKQMLEHFGYTVTISINPLKALDLFRQDPGQFDMVITDLTMPNLSGKELIAEMIKVRPDIPVIICSGHSDLIDSDITDQKGIKAFLAKPVRMIDLNKKIREVFDGGSGDFAED